MDKVRGDSSLIICDIQSALPALSMPPKSTTVLDEDSSLSPHPNPRIPHADVGPRTDSRVLQQHAPTEIVSALSFLPNSTHLLLASISYRWLRLFDLRSPIPATTNVASKVYGIPIRPSPNRVFWGWCHYRMGCPVSSAASSHVYRERCICGWRSKSIKFHIHNY